MPAPRLQSHGSAMQRLAELDYKLSHEFGFLLTLLPPQLFEFRNGNIVLTKELIPAHMPHRSPVYATFDPRTVEFLDQGTSKPEGKRLRGFSKHSSLHQVVLRTRDDCLAAVNQVPPLSWIEASPEWHGTSSWAKQTIAFIEFFTLVWASDTGYTGPLSEPDFNDLKAVFRRLKQTPHYQRVAIRRNDMNYLDIYSSPNEVNGSNYYAENMRAHESDRSLEAPTFGSTPSISAADGTGSQSLQEIRSSSNPQPRRTSYGPELPSERTSLSYILCHEQYHQELFGKNSQLVSAYLTNDRSNVSFPPDLRKVELSKEPYINGADFQDPAIAPSPLAGSPTLETVDHLAPTSFMRALKSPQKNQSHDSPPVRGPSIIISSQSSKSQGKVVDEHLSILQQKVGPNLLSTLAALQMVLFQPLHPEHTHTSYLPVRMLLGTINKMAPALEQGRKVWAIYRIHEKHAKSAPRLVLDAFSSEEDRPVQFNLPFNKVAAGCIDFEPAFTVVTPEGGRQEQQLKALIKYYFILAADTKLYGFEKHFMPVNATFVCQLKSVCKNALGDELAVPPRKRRRLSFENGTTAPATVNADTASVPHTIGTFTRSGRNRKRLHSEIDAPAATSFPQPRPLCTPRKMAFGPLIRKDAPSSMRNEFLDPEIEARDSDGDSGDEIPAHIPTRIHEVLAQRRGADTQIKNHNKFINELSGRKKAATTEMGRIRDRKKDGIVPSDEAEKQIAFQKTLKSICDSRIREFRKSTYKFVKIRKKCDAQLKPIGESRIQPWESIEEEKKKKKKG